MSTETSLAVQNSQPPTSSFGFGAGFVGFSIRPALLSMVQPALAMKNPNAKFGAFYDAKTGTNHERMTVVMAALPRTNRVLLPKGDFGAKPICKSTGCAAGSNVMLPILDNKDLIPQSPRCGVYEVGSSGRPVFKAVCDQASWKKWHESNKNPDFRPSCREQDDFLFVEKDTLLPYRLNIHGESLKPFRASMEGVARYAQADYAKGLHPELYWYQMTLSIKKETNKRGQTYAVLVITDIRPIPVDEREKFKEQFMKFAGVTFTDDTEGTAEGSDAAVEGQTAADSTTTAPVTNY